MNTYNKFSIELLFIQKVLGGIPVDKNNLKQWAKDKNISRNIKARVFKTADSFTQSNSSLKTFRFSRDNQGIYIPSIHIKAHIRDKLIALDLLEEKSIRKKVSITCFVLPKKLRFVYNNNLVVNGDGYEQVKNNLHEYIKPNSSISFELITIADSKLLTFDNIGRVFETGQFSGFGSFREMYGNYKVIKLEFKPNVVFNIENYVECEKEC